MYCEVFLIHVEMVVVAQASAKGEWRIEGQVEIS